MLGAPWILCVGIVYVFFSPTPGQKKKKNSTGDSRAPFGRELFTIAVADSDPS